MTEPGGSAIWAMIVLIVILIMVVIFFCMVPVYKALQTRWKHWDDPENDPRWNADSFQFSPTSPQITRALPHNANNKLQYNRLSNCGSVNSSLRSDSFRNNCRLPRVEDQVEIKMPPAYRDLYTPGSDQEDLCTLDSPPAYYSKTPSPEERTVNTEQQVAVDIPAPAPPAPVKKTFKKIKKAATGENATLTKQAVVDIPPTAAPAPAPAPAPASAPAPAPAIAAPVTPAKKSYKKTPSTKESVAPAKQVPASAPAPTTAPTTAPKTVPATATATATAPAPVTTPAPAPEATPRKTYKKIKKTPATAASVEGKKEEN